MKAHALGMQHLRLINVLQMMNFFCWAKKCEYDKKFRLVYRKPLPRPKSLEKGGENGSRLVFESEM